MNPTQLYLVVPGDVTSAVLAPIVDGVRPACVRLAVADPGLCQMVQGRDIACIASETPAPGFDGVHLLDPAGYAAARAAVGRTGIVGVGITSSRHAAMELGEAGVDYLSIADRDLLAWWAELMEVPCVGIGVRDAEEAAEMVRLGADFLCPDPNLWQSDNPLAAFQAIAAVLK